jgi:acyl carrier protein
VGRQDGQVKIRGMRVELEEIEQLLLEHATVRASAAAVRNFGEDDSRVVAYVVATGLPVAGEVYAERLRQFLASRLPGPCVPAAIVVLDQLPLLSNGKIDRASLPPPQAGASEQPRSRVAPRTDTERQLEDICRGLLRVQEIGVHDDLFELGAHSLLATQIISRVRVKLHAELELRDFFDHPTVAQLAVLAERSRSSPEVPVITIERLDHEKYRRSATAVGDAHVAGGE